MIVLGIDPGKRGALAAIDSHGRLQDVIPMPLIVGRGRDEYDIPGISAWLTRWREDARYVHTFAVLEKGQPLPARMGGGFANYQRGYGRGLFEGLLAAQKIPYKLVAPAPWQKAMHEGTPGSDTKQRSILAAQRLFPAASLRVGPRSRKLHDGMAEALLLAEYGRRSQRIAGEGRA